MLQLLRPGDHVLAIDDLYGGTNRLLRRLGEPMGIEADFVPTSDVARFADALKPNTKVRERDCMLLLLLSNLNQSCHQPPLRSPCSHHSCCVRSPRCFFFFFFLRQVVWVESPTNPLLQVTDIREIVSQVKAKNKDCIVVVDNTFTSAFFQKPLDLGADIEFASVTKYYNGANHFSLDT